MEQEITFDDLKEAALRSQFNAAQAMEVQEQSAFEIRTYFELLDNDPALAGRFSYKQSFSPVGDILFTLSMDKKSFKTFKVDGNGFAANYASSWPDYPIGTMGGRRNAILGMLKRVSDEAQALTKVPMPEQQPAIVASLRKGLFRRRQHALTAG